jgi:hypothetical protein
MVQEIRCSKLDRTMNCLGYHSLEGLMESETNDAAKEGTAIGELLSEMIRQDNAQPNFGSTASNGFHIDNDMWFYAKDTFKTIKETSLGGKITTEQRIDWITRSGITVRGQYDISYIVGTTLHVEDLKYGWRIVDVKKNWQLIGYAIGILFQLHAQGFAPSHIHFKIHQPRPHHEDGPIRSWIITHAELMEYYEQIENRLLALVGGDKTLSTSKSCRYCEGLNECPAANRAFYASVDHVLNEWTQDTLNNDEVSKQLDVLARVQEIIKIKSDSLNQLALMRIGQGQVIPKYSIEQTFGDRKWKKDVSVTSIKGMTSGIDITKMDMLSPAQAEKMGVPKKLVAELVVRENRGTKLVKKDLTEEATKIFTKPF